MIKAFRNKLIKGLFAQLVVTLLLLQSTKVSAQTASTYSFAASSGTYTAVSSSATSTSLSTTLDDGISTTFTFPSGFTFTFAGTAYTQARVSSNGYLVFGTLGSSTAANDLATTTTTLRPLLAPLWDDLQCTSGVKYELSGTSPSRVLTIEWKEMEWNYSSTTAVISFQIKLFETTNIIQYVYKQEPTAYSAGFTGGASIGIKGGSSATDFISLTGAGSSPTTSTSSSTNSIATKPADGQIYQFTPPVFCSGTPTAGATSATSTSICLGASTTLSLPTATTGAGISYQWQSSPDNVAAYTNITGAVSSTYVASPSASIYYRCVVTCSAGPTSVNSTPIQINFVNSIVTTTPNFRCGTGTVSLAATGSAGSTLKWYAAATGGAALATGSPFTTPTIASTTNYYVGAEAIAIGSAVVGSGTAAGNSNTGITPFSLFYTSTHTQYLVLASDLSASGFGPGDLTAMSFNVTSKASSIAYSNYTIKLAHSTATSLTGLLAPSFTSVYGPATYNSVSGNNNFTFGGGGFNWDGSSNIIVDVCFDNVTPGTGYSSNDAVSFVPKSYTATYGMYEDVINMCGVTSGGYTTSANAIPVITFTGNLVCSSPRSIVTATVNAPPTFTVSSNQAICNNTIATLSVTSTLASYNTYIWTPVTNLFTDAACTVAYTAGTSASTVYYKTSTAGATTYTCTANNTTSLCASTANTTVTNLPSSVTVTAMPSSLCFSGNVALNITPATYGAAQFQWQTSSDNSTWGDSTGMVSSSLNTNTILNTRYYRVVLKDGTGAFCLNATSDTALVYKPSVSTVTNGQRCAPGTVDLGATGTDGTLNWFSGSTGGSSLATGTSFTTPFLTSTTTYYVEAEAKPDINGIIGTGTSTTSSFGYPTAFGNYWYQEWQQIVYTAAELTAAGNVPGNISKVSFNISGLPSPSTVSGYALRMAPTTLSTLSAFTTTGLTTVYGPASISPSSGLNTITLSTPYYWDGVSNIIVDIRANGAYGSANATTYYTTTTGNTCLYAYTSSSTIGSAFFTSSPTPTTSTSRPNIQFFQQGCKSSRSPVVATINALPTPTISPATGPVQICAGNTTTFTAGGGGTYQWKNASGILVGETASTFTTGTTGTYRVVVTTASTGCKDSSVFVGVNVNPAPTVSILPSGTRSICADSIQKYTSVVTGSGLTYQWFNGGTLITGATKDSFSASTAGVYSLRVYLGTCSDTSNDATLIVNPLPASSFIKTGTTGAICLGSTLELTALSTPSGYTYQWMLNGLDIPGATSRIYNAPTGGIYTVRIKDGNNCRKISDTMSIINTPMGVPNLLPKEVRFCEGTEIVLYSNAGPYAKLFSWTKDGTLTGDSSATIATGTGGVYDVTVEDVYGCVLTSAKVSLTVDPLPVKPVVTQSGSVLSTVLPYTTYQWYRNGKAIAGSTKRSHTLLFDGYYHVVVANNLNCLNSSDSVMIKNLSVQSISRNDVEIRVYPNPTQNQVTIDAPISVNLSVKDITGKQVMSLKDAKSVDMALFADGIYIFTLTDNDGVVLKMDKVMKKTN